VGSTKEAYNERQYQGVIHNMLLNTVEQKADYDRKTAAAVCESPF
jgi:hypothetical protein